MSPPASLFSPLFLCLYAAPPSLSLFSVFHLFFHFCALLLSSAACVRAVRRRGGVVVVVVVAVFLSPSFSVHASFLALRLPPLSLSVCVGLLNKRGSSDRSMDYTNAEKKVIRKLSWMSNEVIHRATCTPQLLE